MNRYKTTVFIIVTSAIAFCAYAKSENLQENNAKGTGKERGVAKKDAERYRKAAEAGNVEAQEMMGWAYYDKGATVADKAEAMKWWCRAGHRGSEMMKAILRLAYHGNERVLIENAADAITTNGGRPLPVSNEPLAFRVECGRRAYIDKWLGFTDPSWSPFPTLLSVTNATGLNLDFAKRFETSIKGKLAQFLDGEIRWSEDGTNGLSFASTSAKMNAAQIDIVREMMRNFEQKHGNRPDDTSSAKWILNDDFTFGYFTIPHKGGRDEVYYVFTTRHEMNGISDKTSVLVPFAPTQLISDSIMRYFLGDKVAQLNFNALKDVGIVMLIE
ncbi:MAG: sel1 repeat family protein [Kiritimatiellae bacterium]|nr:sel1 repeat family protein [Kiritimatiellia bacterium]